MFFFPNCPLIAIGSLDFIQLCPSPCGLKPASHALVPPAVRSDHTLGTTYFVLLLAFRLAEAM